MDISVLLFLQEIRFTMPDIINTIFVYISALVNSPVPIIFAVVWYWCVNKKVGLILMSNIIVAQVALQTVKLIACVNRPWILDSRVMVDSQAAPEATGYSFPSGHTSMATAFFGTFLVCYRKKVWVVITTIVLIVLVAFSRMWLGCHTPQDVFFGLLLTAACMCLVFWIAYVLPKYKNLDIIVATILFVVSIAALVVCSLKAYPMDYDAAGNLLVNPLDMQVDIYKAVGCSLAFCIAWVIERRFIKFDVKGSTKEKIIRGVIGSIVVAAFFIIILPAVLGLFLDNNWTHFFKYFITVILGLLVYPACIKWWQNRHAK